MPMTSPAASLVAEPPSSPPHAAAPRASDAVARSSGRRGVTRPRLRGDVELPGHAGVQRARVLDGAGLGRLVGEGAAGAERLGLEVGAAGGGDVVVRAVGVLPRDGL